MSQVKNLRAMFESKGDSSPPDSRGRSPTAASSTSEAPRPLSKIRTNFVAVEKDGRIGLKRDQSGDSSVSRRRLSNDTEPSLYRTRSKMSTQDDSVRTPAAESIPEAPDAVEVATEQPSNISENSGNSPAKPKDATPAKPAAASRPSVTPSKTATKPAASKTEPMKRPATKPVAPTRATGGTAKKPAPVKTGTNDAGFVKPKPKSPTKPVHLPSSLMAPTAASAHKGGAARQSNLPQSASAHAVGSSTASKPVKRQSSVANRQRPSLGVPSTSKPPQEPASSKRASHVDEGFLARMMRPTAASSSKTTDKGAPTTPPKKTAPRTSNVGAENVKRTVKSPVANRAGSAARSREATSRAEKAATKPPTTKKTSSVTKAAAAPAAAATAAVAGAAAVASKVLPDSATSKLADKLQDLGIEEPKEELKRGSAPERTSEPEAHPVPEPVVPEPEATTIAEAASAEEVEPEIEPEIETRAEPETVEEYAEEPETIEDTHPDVEEKHEIAPVEEIEEPEPVAEEKGLVAKDIIQEPVIEEDLHAREEPAPLEEAALEAAQVETAEEAIDIAEEADKHSASLDNIVKPEEPVVEHPAAKESAVGNGHVSKLDPVVDAEPASTVPKLPETTPEHAEEVIGEDADTAA
ncbi:hypothetical protein LMH87_005377 [Akanthomyces muscarius]|uniref:Mucin-7 n=1 Tax=Akanthomyces muscarius TaxID=2231603 RepID=A0A9W8QLP7_AKAMU|nr:hypothetical protein LMH87_005377 [Akanthomyces muscarius]KAJ4163665.1 hypothetical protein LMH87_005377 [Akanthomyces muscarius]